MSIRGKLFLTAALLTVVSCTVIAVALYYSRGVAEQLRDADVAQDVAQAVAELTLLTDSYLAYGERRVETQWHSRADRIRQILEDRESPEPVQALPLVFDSLTRSFTTLQDVHAELRLAEEETERLRMVVERIGARMRMDSQNLLTRTFAIAREAREQASFLQDRSSRAIVLLGTLLILVTLVTTLGLAMTVSGRMARLLQGSREVGRGRLQHRIGHLGTDEIGLLAGSFDEMTANLDRLVRQEQEAQEALQQLNAQLESRVVQRTRELEAFTYSVSHDLRAPLRAVDGFARFLHEDYADRLDQEGIRFITVIRSNVQRMDKLITDLLTLSRVTRSELSPVIVDMSSLARSVVEEVAPEEVRREFAVVIEPLPAAMGDVALLKQVWMNLLSNAFKYSAVTETRRIEIGTATTAGEQIYFVKDHGVGFDGTYAHKIFGVFERLHNADQFEGTGVGLAIVAQIVLRHGGRVWAEGEEGRGATMYFSLPRQ
jgi:signal transduction histidine kinase